jgi:HKD family nuclease
MDNAVISDKLGELLDLGGTGREVKAAVFTSYTFDPEFFELEIIPLLLASNIPFSSDSRVKQFQVRDALRQSELDLEVFYDVQIFRKEGQNSPSMEYLFHGVHRGNDAFHAKLILLLVSDQDTGSDFLLAGAGSNNLTQSGWWDNIECQHWEIVKNGEASRAFLNRLREDVTYLQSEQKLQPRRGTSALEQIGDFLADCRASNQADPVAYYGVDSINNNLNFRKFLQQQARTLWHYNNWTLEIISPFFAEDTKNREHEFFFDLGVQKIHLLLPMDQSNQAICQSEYFDHINHLEGIEWAEWEPKIKQQLGFVIPDFRRLHAKIYHFYNAKQSWVFVGSVNFSHKAMMDNIEAGYLVKLPSAGRLLRPIEDYAKIECTPPAELFPGPVSEDDQHGIPHIFLGYDWIEKKLVGSTERYDSYCISIFTPEGHAAIKDWIITDEPCTYDENINALETLLKNGSLVKVGGYNAGTREPFTSHVVMLQQTGWSHKPNLEMQDLTSAQILAIYAGMSPERRQLLLTNTLIRKLVVAKQAGEMTDLTDDFAADGFFSEYAEIFHAFKRLKHRLANASDENNHHIVDYYLTGAGVDSLPTLIDRSTNDDSAETPVTTYLVLLCAKEIFQEKMFLKRPLIKQRLNDVRKHIRSLKQSDRIRLESDSAVSRNKFFKWFEGQFLKNYRSREEFL